MTLKMGIFAAAFLTMILLFSPMALAQAFSFSNLPGNILSTFGIGNCNDGIDNEGDGYADYLSPQEITNLTVARSLIEAQRHTLVSQFAATQQLFTPYLNQLQNAISPYNQAQIDLALAGMSNVQQQYTAIYNQADAINFQIGEINKKLLTDPECTSAIATESFSNPLTQCIDQIDNDGDTLTDFRPEDRREHAAVEQQILILSSGELTASANQISQIRNLLLANYNNIITGGLATPQYLGNLYITMGGWVAWANDFVAAEQYAINIALPIEINSDPDCTDFFDNSESGITACNDGIDNDGDFFVDFPADQGCTSLLDVTEDPFNPGLTQCSDGLDNDNDAVIDLNDPDCINQADNSENNFNIGFTQCSDTIDNDGDLLIDLLDPGCISVFDNDEGPFNAGITQCSDGIDNDGDGVVDLNDPGCASALENNELPYNFAPAQTTTFAPNDYNIFLSKIRYATGDEVRPGDTLGISVNLKNEGRVNFESLSFSISVPELGIYSGKSRSELDRGDSGTFSRVITIPKNTPKGEYYARITFYTEGNSGRRTVYKSFTVI